MKSEKSISGSTSSELISDQVPAVATDEATTAKKDLDRYERLVAFTNLQIERTQKVYATIGSIVSVAVVVSGWLAWSSVRDMRSEVRNEVDQATTQINRLRFEVSQRVDRELSRDEIKGVIRERTIIAVENLAGQSLSNAVKDTVAPVGADVENLRNKTQIAVMTLAATLSQASNLIEFQTTILKAQNDDREAFNKLIELGQDKTFSFQTIAQNAYTKIRVSYFSPFSEPSWLVIDWPKDADTSKWDIAHLRAEYAAVPQVYKADMIHTIWAREDIQKRDRMMFLRDVLEKDHSLSATFFAGKFFATEAGLQWQPFNVTPLLEWWDKHKDSIK